VVGEVANLVFLISKEEGCSYNKATKIVTQILVDKCKEMQLVALELKEYCKIHEATTTQMVVVDHYISCCKILQSTFKTITSYQVHSSILTNYSLP